MRTTSGVMPKTYEIELFTDNSCDIIFATNVIVTEIPITNTGDTNEATEGETETQYVYDLFRLHMPYSDNLSDRIGENYTTWLAMAMDREMHQVVSTKTNEIKDVCQSTIYNGIDLNTQYGLEHFSLSVHDQQNLSAIQAIIAAGAENYPYHADGKGCVLYSANDLSNLVESATKYITYHTTYHNMLKIWINRETDIEVVRNIQYGCALPDDLQEYMETLI